MPGISQGIDDRQAARHEAIQHVFGQQQSAASLRRRGQDQPIPELQLVIDAQIGGGERSSGFRYRAAECVGEFKKGRARTTNAGQIGQDIRTGSTRPFKQVDQYIVARY
ncbi:hypothetical protein [Sphingobium chungbukense]|uniref:Uncharacterized protein n=1 Tax=Sphingobium chungbukense TaxID=56193 RepID=A0A0M3AHI5_9SPHN|nr:hypothetical protein [Sphingobium chungbukense]KKW89488.1 hypothetical protein YP76_24860 [Sphingobium chungbukense]